jgi:hypothetical protein
MQERTVIPTFRESIEWIAGGAQGNRPEMYCGDHYLVAVRVVSDEGSREWWEFAVIAATEGGWDVDGNSWGWSWDEVEWYVPVKFLSPPVPVCEARKDA